MMLGLGLGLGLGGARVPAFDPATLALTVYLDGADYNAGTGAWAGKASAGSSSSHSASSSGANPTAGATLNGIATVAFARSLVQSLLLDYPLSSLVSASAWSAWCLCNLNAADTDQALYENNDCIFADTGGGYLQMGYRQTGPHHGVEQYHSGTHVAEATFTTGAWQLLQWRYDGANVQARTNAGVWVPTAAGSIDVLTNHCRIGSNYSNAHFIDGLVASFGMAATSFDDATFENIRKSLNARWGLSL